MKFVFTDPDAKSIFDDPEIKTLFEKLNSNAEGNSNEPPGEHFKDPLASQTKWNQLSNSNLKFRSKKLITIDARRVAVKPTARTIGMVLLFLAVLLGSALGRIVSTPSFVSLPQQPVAVIMARAGLPFVQGAFFVFLAGIVAYAMHPLLFTTVFDKKRGHFWNAWVGNRPRLRPLARSGLLADIHAVQLLGGYLSRRSHRHTIGVGPRSKSVSGGFYRYELNLVLNDASRLHVMAHGDEKSLREDAERLASFLGKPLWAVTPMAGE